MNYYTIESFFEHEQYRQTDFQDFVNLTKGRSIISAADWGGNRIEIGLSGNVMLRFISKENDNHISIIKTTNKEEIPAIAMSLGDMPQYVSLGTIEKKLKGLRTLYAILYLLQTGREKELESYLIKHPRGDIEEKLLLEDEKIKIESISYGSWLLTIWTKTKEAFSVMKSIVFLVYQRGREAIIQKMEAEATIAKEKSLQESIETARKEFELKRERMEYAIELSNKMQIPEIREHLQKRIIESVNSLILEDKNDHLLK
jgi:hypothetical protein